MNINFQKVFIFALWLLSHHSSATTISTTTTTTATTTTPFRKSIKQLLAELNYPSEDRNQARPTEEVVSVEWQYGDVVHPRLTPISNEEAEQRHLLLAADPEFISSYERNGFYPALSEGLNQDFRVYNVEIMNSIRLFFNDYITGIVENPFSPFARNVFEPMDNERNLLPVAITIQSTECNQERWREIEASVDELEDHFKRQVKWLLDLIEKFLRESKLLNESFQPFMESATSSDFADRRRNDLRNQHNILTSRFLTETRAARRQLQTMREDIMRRFILGDLILEGIRYARTQIAGTVFTVSNVAGLTTLNGRPVCRGPLPTPHMRFRDKRATNIINDIYNNSNNINDVNDMNDNSNKRIICPMNIVYATNLSDMNPFNRAKQIKITVEDDKRVQMKQQNRIDEAIAKGDLGRLHAVLDCMNSVLKYWYQNKDYYVLKNFYLWQTLNNFEVAIKDTPHLSYLEQAKMADDMAQFIADTLRIGDWYNDYEKFYKSVMSNASSRREKISASTLPSH
jgi:hypothetical protein